MLKDYLTNENLRGICRSNFELALRAIDFARYYIKSGHEFTLDDVLEELRKSRHKKDIFKDLEAAEALDEQEKQYE